MRDVGSETEELAGGLAALDDCDVDHEEVGWLVFSGGEELAAIPVEFVRCSGEWLVTENLPECECHGAQLDTVRECEDEGGVPGLSESLCLLVA